MNICRLALITLSLVLITACGGGGGGGTAAAPTTPRDGDEPVNPFANLADFMPIANSSSLQAVQEITGTSGVRLNVGDAYAEGALFSTHAISCQAVCLIDLPSIGNTGFDLTNSTPNLSFVNDNLDNANSQITNSQTVNGVAIAQGRLTGMKNNIPVEFHTFAGWLDGSIFGVTQISIGTSGSEEYRFAPYNVGDASNSSPTATGAETSATWGGITVATIKADRTFILGDAEITVNFTDTNVDLEFDNWRDLDNQAVSMPTIRYNDLGLNNFGVFSGSFMDNEEVVGRFYQTDHNEVGGNFNTETVTGAFAGTKQ